jgi:hypothetical protein
VAGEELRGSHAGLFEAPVYSPARIPAGGLAELSQIALPDKTGEGGKSLRKGPRFFYSEYVLGREQNSNASGTLTSSVALAFCEVIQQKRYSTWCA